MTKKSKLYSKNGDAGQTTLTGGSKISKSSDPVHIYGEIDELNATIGIVLAHMSKDDEDFSILSRVQKTLFSVGGYFACESSLREKFNVNGLSIEQIENIEMRIDAIDETLPTLTEFVMPGGSELSSFLHLARTVCRRVERNIIELNMKENDVPETILSYVNRLSDYLFVLSRKF